MDSSGISMEGLDRRLGEGLTAPTGAARDTRVAPASCGLLRLRLDRLEEQVHWFSEVPGARSQALTISMNPRGETFCSFVN